MEAKVCRRRRRRGGGCSSNSSSSKDFLRETLQPATVCHRLLPILIYIQ